MKTRKLVSCLMILVFPVIGLSRADLPDSSNLVLPHKGSQALEFGLSGLFSVGSYIGNTIALKKFSSPHSATRYALNISSDGYQLSGDSHEFEYYPSIGDSTVDSTSFDNTSKNRRQDIFLSVQWLKYKKPYGNLSLLLGAGPLIGFDQSIRENAIDPRQRTGESNWYDNNDMSTAIYLGLVPVVGVEWFLHKNISFHSEYYTLMKVGWRTATQDNTREYDSGSWYKADSELSGVYYSVRSYARAGVAFYFE
jgi:hypothetical protein